MSIFTGRNLEVVFVVSLFLGYLLLWFAKKKQVINRTGVDPEVFEKATTPVQSYYAKLMHVFTIGVVVLIFIHRFGPSHWAALKPMDVLCSIWVDFIGLSLGVVGLGVCLVAQQTMGRSWRVGIDVEHPTSLITHGIYSWSRNPTYLGLFTLNLGFWLIWPTSSIATYAMLFFFVMEIQVRCEEEYLIREHGDTFLEYRSATRRYFPRVY